MRIKIANVLALRYVPIATAVVLMIFLIAASRSSAQTSDTISLAISPQTLDVSINPGSGIQNVFRLTNGGDDPITVQAVPKNFTPRGNEGAIDLTEDDTSFSLAKWISVSPETTTIQPKQVKDFNVSINVPENAEPGGHFGSVVFRTVPPEQEGNVTLISQEIAPVILVKVPGDVTESAEISDFYSVNNTWTNQQSAQFELIVKNTGNIHFRPTGKVVVKNLFGREVASFDLASRNVIPGAERKLDAQWSDFGFQFGKYTAEATLVYGEDNTILSAQTAFYIIPYQKIIPVAAVILILVIIIVRSRRRLTLAIKVLTGKHE